MSKYFKDLTAISIIVLGLYICGTLYYITYWSTFNIDVSPYINVQDVPKSFIYVNTRFIFVAIISLLYLRYEDEVSEFYYLYIRGRFKKTSNNSKETDAKIKRWLKIKKTHNKNLVYFKTTKVFGKILIIIDFLYLITHESDILKYTGTYIADIKSLLILLNAGCISFWLYLNPIIQSTKFLDAIKVIITTFLVLLYIYIDTKNVADKIYYNTTKPTIKLLTKDSTLKFDTIPLKYLGSVGEKLIVSKLDNSQKFILNKESLSGFVMIYTTHKK